MVVGDSEVAEEIEEEVVSEAEGVQDEVVQVKGVAAEAEEEVVQEEEV